MDLRVLNYFLTVAKEGNITHAADILHITQPTLSRQLRDLEEELGTVLLERGNRKISLTDAGVLFQQRATELVTLLDKTQRDLIDQHNLIGGTVSIGCVESSVSKLLPEILSGFVKEHPMVKYNLYSANGDDIKEKLDRGEIDLGILIDPVEAAKYDYIRLPVQDRWGIILKEDHPLAQQSYVSLEEASLLPLILPRREIVQEEIASWFGAERNRLNVFALHNLLTNAIPFALAGLGYTICVEGSYTIRPVEGITFVPIAPERFAGHVLAWKKNRVLASAATRFISHIKNTI